MRSEQMGPTRLAGMALGMRPSDMVRAVSNPSELTARLRYQQTFLDYARCRKSNCSSRPSLDFGP
jgi:hypothetical protein